MVNRLDCLDWKLCCALFGARDEQRRPLLREAVAGGGGVWARYLAMRDTQPPLALALATGRATRAELVEHLAAYVACVTDPSGSRVRTEDEAREEWLRAWTRPVAEAEWMRRAGETMTGSVPQRRNDADDPGGA